MTQGFRSSIIINNNEILPIEWYIHGVVLLLELVVDVVFVEESCERLDVGG
jgi:hypothetical protein